MAYQLSKEYLWKEIGDQVVILHFESGRYYSLNSSSSLIWKGLLDRQTPDQIIQRLCAEFDVDEQTAREDTELMARSFVDKNFLIKN